MENPGELLSIKAFAEAAGRSQQTIYKQIGTRLASYVHEKEGQKYIERRALAEVFKLGEVQPSQPETINPGSTFQPDLNGEIAFLRGQLEAKDRQIEAQQTQISQLTAALENTTASLHAAQALHAGTMKQMLPEGEQEPVAAEVDSAGAPEPAEAARKWWQFWKA